VIYEPNDYFNEEYLFICLRSQKGCTVKANCYFKNEDEQTSKRRALMQEETVFNANNSYGFGNFEEEGGFKLLRGRTVKEKRDNFKKQVKLMAADDFIKNVYAKHVEGIKSRRKLEKQAQKVTSRNLLDQGYHSYIDKNRQEISFYQELEGKRR